MVIQERFLRVRLDCEEDQGLALIRVALRHIWCHSGVPRRKENVRKTFAYQDRGAAQLDPGILNNDPGCTHTQPKE